MDTDADKETPSSPLNTSPEIIPVVEEEVQVGKRWRDVGQGVRVRKQTQQSEQVVRQDLVHEEIEVRHIPVDQVVNLEAAPAVRQMGDTLIIPVTEEILVVEKRLRIREEVHVTRTRRSSVHSEIIPVTSESVFIERFDDSDSTNPDPESSPDSQQTGSS